MKSLADRLVVFDDDRVFVFEGTYEDFLTRVGWQGEETGVTEAGVAENRKTASPDRKEARRLKAELVTERGRVLNALLRGIEAAENEIMELEKRIDHDTAALVKASEKGDWQPMAELSKSTHEARQRIEALFAELEKLTAEHEAQTRIFDERLKALIQE